ncbi:MAG TPA: hypothetical protein DD856_11600 [Sulfobacillus sp.]|nr:hypothetical protein [Sulfobacillus sp.]
MQGRGTSFVAGLASRPARHAVKQQDSAWLTSTTIRHHQQERNAMTALTLRVPRIWPFMRDQRWFERDMARRMEITPAYLSRIQK